jgi:hypothetical protein
MKRIILLIVAFAALTAHAQKTKSQASPEVKLVPENWTFKEGTVEFLDHKGRKAMKLLTSSDRVILKNLDFKDGTIEYDVEFQDPRFASMYFRWQSGNENECFYFRTQRAGNPQAVDAIQYAPHVKGVNLWDLLFHFQTGADFKSGEWNHVKLVVSGKQLRAYVNDMTKAALVVPHLEGDVANGTIAFDGQVIISNVVVKPNVVEGLSPEPGLDLTQNDIRYLRKWQVTRPVELKGTVDFDYSFFPGDTTQWENVTAERNGLINLTRRFGIIEGRRLVWLRTTIQSAKAQSVTLRLGFSDEVWVGLNRQMVYLDKNFYASPMMKTPDGRISLENSTVTLPLNQGDNSLIIGVANNFYGWGIIARLDKLVDLKIER